MNFWLKIIELERAVQELWEALKDEQVTRDEVQKFGDSFIPGCDARLSKFRYASDPNDPDNLPTRDGLPVLVPLRVTVTHTVPPNKWVVVRRGIEEKDNDWRMLSK